MFQIIDVDNFGRDYETEHVRATDIPTEELAKRLAAAVNRGRGGGSRHWCVVKPNDYKPYVFTGY